MDMDVLVQIIYATIFLFQLLTIHLDESDVFSAWVSAKELGFTPQSESVDTKCKPPTTATQHKHSSPCRDCTVKPACQIWYALGKKFFVQMNRVYNLHIAKNMDKWLNGNKN